MPGIKDQMDSLLGHNLEASGVPMITFEDAQQQEIPTTDVVLANMMPAKVMQATERQWGEQYCTHPNVAVALLLAKFANDCREGPHPTRPGKMRSRTENLRRYTELPDIQTPVDVLILTGDNEEIEPNPDGLSSEKPIPKPLDGLDYGTRLHNLVEWGERNAAVTVVSCLASHFVLNYFHNTPKRTLDKKAFGVYEHEIPDNKDLLVRGLSRTITAPHSRWGDVSINQIEARNDKLKEARRLKILAASTEIGWLIIKETLPNGNIRIYLQGHPEYDRDDLKQEFQRDQKTGIALPANYFPTDDQHPEGNPERTPHYKWPHGARVLNHNILRESCRIHLPAR